MDPNEMTPTQYFVQKILNKQPIEPMDEVPLGPSLSDLLNTALGQRACGWYFRVLLPLCPPNLRWKCWLLAGRASMLAGNRRAAREGRVVCEYES